MAMRVEACRNVGWRIKAVATLLAVALASPGCTKTGPRLVVVRGTLLLDGQPLVAKSILFSPEDGTAGLGAGANSRADGTFELLAIIPGSVRNQAGVMPGTYRVVVAEPLIAIDTAQPAADGEPAPAVGFRDVRAEKGVIPAVYRSRETTPLIVEVTPETGAMTLELTSGK
jgi:hypothetical protein